MKRLGVYLKPYTLESILGPLFKLLEALLELLVPLVVADIIDTGIGAAFSLILNLFLPSRLDKQRGFDLSHTLARWQKSNDRPDHEKYPEAPSADSEQL